MEGTELERSANVFDLSFVPDDMVFDDEYRYASASRRSLEANLCRDEATEQDLNSNYKGLEFVTDVSGYSTSNDRLTDANPKGVTPFKN